MAERRDEETCNEVTLVGRVSAPADEKTLPSGDVLLTWRVVVDRPSPRRAAPEGTRLSTVDAIDCVAWPAGIRRTAAGFGAGDVVRVEGSLRRRFWRTPAGLQSKYEVEVAATKRLTRAQPAN
jgi:single-strand DNA-binding protein